MSPKARLAVFSYSYGIFIPTDGFVHPLGLPSPSPFSSFLCVFGSRMSVTVGSSPCGSDSVGTHSMSVCIVYELVTILLASDYRGYVGNININPERR